MIESLSYRIAAYIKGCNEEETASIEVMKYSLSLILNNLSVFACTALIGYFLGVLDKALIAYGSFALLRFFSGGYHHKSLDWCVVLSVMLFIGISFVPVSSTVAIVLTVLALILVGYLAPNNMRNTTISPRIIPYFKMVSCFIVALSLLFHSDVMTLAIFSQSVLLIPTRR